MAYDGAVQCRAFGNFMPVVPESCKTEVYAFHVVVADYRRILSGGYFVRRDVASISALRPCLIASACAGGPVIRMCDFHALKEQV